MLFQFGVDAEGENLSYRWFRNGSAIPLATFSTYSTREVGDYHVVVTGACGQTTRSRTVSMRNIVKAEVGLQPPFELRAKEGTSVEIRITLKSGSAPVTYQWAVDGQDILGATEPTLRIASVKATDAGRYVCVVRNECGIDVSNACNLSVYPDNPTSVDEDERGQSMRITPMPMRSTSSLAVKGVQPGAATLSIHDVAGREVFVRLVTIPADGSFTMSLDASLLPSAGSYVVRLRTESGELSRVMMVVP
jgi:hypothetical protein